MGFPGYARSIATAATLPKWVILDRFVFMRGYTASLPDKGYAPLTAEGSTSQGVVFCIALCLTDPPAISHLYVQLPADPPLENLGCNLVAAHGDLLLLAITDEVKSGDPYDDWICCQDNFVCRVASPHRPTLLKRLPECTERIFVRTTRDGHDITTQRLFYHQCLGLLARGEQDFAVVQLERVRGMEAELCVLRTSVSAAAADAIWEAKRFPILHPDHKDIFGWATDAAFPFKNYICWVDYYAGGSLFFDVFEESPKVSYLALPIRDKLHPTYDFKSYIEMYRSVCVTGDGNSLKFVHLDREDGKFFDPVTSAIAFTITSYVFEITEGGNMVWSEDASIKSDKFWPSICANSASVPEDILTFPLVSMEKDHGLHFLFYEPMDDTTDKVSVVTIDMNTETLVSFDPYIQGGDEGDTLRFFPHAPVSS